MMVKTVDAIKVRNLMSRDVVDADLTKSLRMSMDDLIMPYEPPSDHNKFDSDEKFKKFFHDRTKLMKHLIDKYVSNIELRTFHDSSPTKSLSYFKKEKPKSNTEEIIRGVFFKKYRKEDFVYLYDNTEAKFKIYPSSTIVKIDEAHLCRLLKVKELIESTLKPYRRIFNDSVLRMDDRPFADKVVTKQNKMWQLGADG